MAIAAFSAASACESLAATSGASSRASVSPAFTRSPSCTYRFRIRPGTLLETLYSSASACPWMKSEPLSMVKIPMSATMATTAARVINASKILLCCDFSVVILIGYFKVPIDLFKYSSLILRSICASIFPD